MAGNGYRTCALVGREHDHGLRAPVSLLRGTFELLHLQCKLGFLPLFSAAPVTSTGFELVATDDGLFRMTCTPRITPLVSHSGAMLIRSR